MPLIQLYITAQTGKAGAFQVDLFRERTAVIHNSICLMPRVDESIGDSP
jgi:hypothetical protein